MKITIVKDKRQVDAATSPLVTTRDATNNLFYLFTFLGINMPTKSNLKYIAYSGVINGLVTIFLPIAFTISYISPSSDMKIGNLLNSLQVCINVYGCSVKVIIMGFLLKRLRKSEIIIDKLDARCVAEDEKGEIRKAVRSGNRLVFIFAMVYYSYSTSTFLTAVSSGMPPYSLYIPLVNWRESTMNFVIAAATEYVLMTIACTQQVVDDAYSVIYIGIIRRHIQILLLRISKLGSDPMKSKEENTQELVNCIMDHRNIIELFGHLYLLASGATSVFHSRLHDIIQSVISKTIFIQFLITAVILGTTLINILIFADLSSIIASLFYVAAVVLQILPCCYYANCLMVESDQFSNVIFHSNWVEQDAKFRKMLVFFIQQSQKTITLTAGKIFPINLASFLGIAKFSFSLFTFLSQMEYGER